MEVFCPSLECLSVRPLLTHLNATLQRAWPWRFPAAKSLLHLYPPFSTGTKDKCTRQCFWGRKRASWELSLNHKVISWGGQVGGCMTAWSSSAQPRLGQHSLTAPTILFLVSICALPIETEMPSTGFMDQKVDVRFINVHHGPLKRITIQ